MQTNHTAGLLSYPCKELFFFVPLTLDIFAIFSRDFPPPDQARSEPSQVDCMDKLCAKMNFREAERMYDDVRLMIPSYSKKLRGSYS